MRRTFVVALENQHVGDPLGDENISMEEEALMIDEADQSAQEVNQDLGDAERIVQVAESLEDLAVVAGSKEELSPHEAHLMEKAGDMAVAGTDVEPDEIVPAMESFKGADGKISGKLAMENFKETASRLWENIKRILKEVWSKIEAFFYKIFGTIPSQRRKLKDLAARVSEANSKTRENAKFTIATNRYMVTGSTAIKTGAAYDSALKEFVATSKWVYGTYVSGLKGDGEKIAKALEDFDVEKPNEATDQLASALGGGQAKVPGGKAAGGSRWPKHKVEQGHDLLGGVSLFTISPEKGEGGALARLEQLRQAQCELAPSSEKAKDNSSTVEFTTLGQPEASSMIKDCEAILDAMEDYQRGKAKGEIQTTKKKIEAASGKAETAAGKLKASDDADGKAAIPNYRALINFNVSYARWVQSPIIPFTKLAIGVINTTRNLIERSLTQYK